MWHDAQRELVWYADNPPPFTFNHDHSKFLGLNSLLHMARYDRLLTGIVPRPKEVRFVGRQGMRMLHSSVPWGLSAMPGRIAIRDTRAGDALPHEEWHQKQYYSPRYMRSAQQGYDSVVASMDPQNLNRLYVHAYDKNAAEWDAILAGDYMRNGQNIRDEVIPGLADGNDYLKKDLNGAKAMKSEYQRMKKTFKEREFISHGLEASQWPLWKKYYQDQIDTITRQGRWKSLHRVTRMVEEDIEHWNTAFESDPQLRTIYLQIKQAQLQIETLSPEDLDQYVMATGDLNSFKQQNPALFP